MILADCLAKYKSDDAPAVFYADLREAWTEPTFTAFTSQDRCERAKLYSAGQKEETLSDCKMFMKQLIAQLKQVHSTNTKTIYFDKWWKHTIFFFHYFYDEDDNMQLLDKFVRLAGDMNFIHTVLSSRRGRTYVFLPI